jgi:hypothetical protein
MMWGEGGWGRGGRLGEEREGGREGKREREGGRGKGGGGGRERDRERLDPHVFV